jgi:LMBR1 domain-containing protein 1
MVMTTPEGWPKNPFLNTVLLYLENSSVPFFGTFFLTYFCIYLLCCCMKGNLKMGIRIPFIFSVHPMK